MKIVKRAMHLVIALTFIFSFASCGSNKIEDIEVNDIDLSVFYEEYLNNELAAKEKYFEKRYRITSEVDDIFEGSVIAGHDITSSFIASRQYPPKEYFRFTLEYLEDQRDYVLSLSEGDSITFEGTLVSYSELSPMVLEDVVFIYEEESDVNVSSEELYAQAVSLLADGNKVKAAMLFGKVSGYKDAKEKSLDLWHEITVRETIATGYFHAVGLKEDGTVVATKYKGDQYKGQCDVDDWTDVVAVSAAGTHTIGLKADGTVCAVGDNAFDQCSVEGWTNIIAVATGDEHTVGLKADGTVVAISYLQDERCNVDGWEDIVAVAAGYHTVGLKSDGTVVAVGDNDFGQCNVEKWTDIVAISAGGNRTVGLKSDGTVVAVGLGSYGQCDVDNWTDIVAVSTSGIHTVGLRADGTVVAVGYGKEGECNVYNWTDIVAVATELSQTVGLKADGTVVVAGDKDDYDQRDVGNWANIKLPETIK